jgi:type IV pilus assembly protein PilF
MVILIGKRLGVVAGLLALAGCVTTSTIDEVEPSRKEAAQYNLQLGIGYLRQGELKTAQEKLEKSIADDSSNATAHSALGLVFERLGDDAGAEKHYRKAVRVSPDDPDSLNALAVFLCLKKGDPGQAMNLFDRALAVPLSKAFANKAMLYTTAGTCAGRLDLARAENYLRAAIAADPNYNAALLQLANVANTRGNHLQARAFIERYLAVAPASPDALWLGVQIERALGDASASRAYGQRLRTEFPQSVETRLLLESERGAG